jgi:hypothetical protein
MMSVIQTRMVFHNISARVVWGCADNSATQAFAINLLLAEYLYMGSGLQRVAFFDMGHFVFSIVISDSE